MRMRCRGSPRPASTCIMQKMATDSKPTAAIFMPVTVWVTCPIAAKTSCAAGG